MNGKTKTLVSAAMLASLTCVATMIIKIPSPVKGYLNLGDCVVLLAGWMLPPGYAFLAAGLGSALADLFSGYAAYVPATFVIKGTMAVIAIYAYRRLEGRLGVRPARILSGVLAETEMVLGYFLFESLLYGAAPSAVNIPANAVQGAAGLILGIALLKTFEKTDIIKTIR
jgi:uncharacterized membrane protein